MENKVDWFYLRKSLVIFFAGLVIAILMIVVGTHYESIKKDEYEQSLSTLSATHQKYSNIINDIDLLEQYKSRYAGYKVSGLVGVERRLSWVESLESTNADLQLPAINYKLLPQEEFKRPGFNVTRGVNVKGSIMVLRMDLLHEEDLLTLIEGLKLSTDNIFTVESCSITRSSPVSSSLNTKSANLSSNCRLRWVTIDVK
ncbi:MAG: hypothetical protein ACI9YO_000264 [Gammaproteobacteria bacterium]|jgi:hypothetical protein